MHLLAFLLKMVPDLLPAKSYNMSQSLTPPTINFTSIVCKIDFLRHRKKEKTVGILAYIVLFGQRKKALKAP